MWVMNIFCTLPIFTELFWIWCWVASPQSKSQTSPSRRRANAEWFRVDDGWADALPRMVMLTEDRVLMGYMPGIYKLNIH